MSKKLADADLERFWRGVDVSAPNECWEWKFGLRSGYGRIVINRVGVSTHRLSWELHHGRSIPDGLHILHHCDNKRCVNPDHLYAGTKADNGRDASERGRMKAFIGSSNPATSLTERTVRKIRMELFRGLSIKRTAAMFGVGATTVAHIRARRTWRHIP